MPKLKRGGREIKLKEGEEIRDAAEEMGIPFSCKEGNCGTCACIVKSGEENLSKINEKEEMLGMGEGMRLACQCKILKGNVELE